MGPAPLVGHAAIVAILAEEVADLAATGLSFTAARREMRRRHPNITVDELIDAEALHLARARVEAAAAGRPGVAPLQDELNRLLGLQGQARVLVHVSWTDPQGVEHHRSVYVDLIPGQGVEELQRAADEEADAYGSGPDSGGPPANWEIVRVL